MSSATYPTDSSYLMEHVDETQRLDIKTDRDTLVRQALWAGLQAGMRVADAGCGIGKTTAFLHELAQPGGEAVGIDFSEERLQVGRERFASGGAKFIRHDLRQPLKGMGDFDFIWSRFFLEYHRRHAAAIVRNLAGALRPGGTLCLIDLDHNCLSHEGMTPKLQQAIFGVMKCLEEQSDFDPYMGRKLYSFLYDLGFEDIELQLGAHHLIYGALSPVDEFNWMRKLTVAAQNSGYSFAEFDNGFDEFFELARAFIHDPRRFSYTPIIMARGRKPEA